MIPNINPYKGNFDLQDLGTGGIANTFNLSRNAYTSAGVYSKAGKLLRTLWSGVYLTSGLQTMPVRWDGKDDFGNSIADGDYNIIVQDNNASVIWRGVIGNTSTALTGNTVHLSYEYIYRFCVDGTRVYLAGGYSELSSSQSAFDISNPQVKIPIAAERDNGQTALFVACDSNNVYYAGDDVGGNHFVMGYVKSNLNGFVFTNGAPSSFHIANSSNVKNFSASVFSLYNGNNYAITGYTCQYNGGYHFVCRAALNQIYVHDKTGLLVQTLSYNNPKCIRVDETDGKLWLSHSPSGAQILEKFTINSDGTLITTGVTVTGIGDAGEIDAKNNTLLVCDAALASQQVKAFNATTGASLWTLGQAGGYTTIPDVASDKFYWQGSYQYYPCSVGFQSDGSFWVNDYGNNRLMHWNADRTYTGTFVGYVSRFYTLTTELTDNTKLFLGWKEYQIDYSKPVGQCWTLIKNWLHTAPFTGQTVAIGRVVTFSNGRRYVILNISNTYKLFWFSSTGLVDINKGFGGYFSILIDDGSFVAQSYPTSSGQIQYTKYLVTGYDSNNHPVYDAGTIVATTGSIGNNDTNPSYFTRNQGYKTASGKCVFFDTYPIINSSNQSAQSGKNQGYHLGFVNEFGTDWIAQTANSTYTNYGGAMPVDGTFDVGNGVNYNAGSCVLVIDNTVIWGYHGEFWKSTQANCWNQVSDIGLFVQHFGYANERALILSPTNVALAGMAGNAFAAALVKFGTTKRLYHNDESFHGGAHVWDIIGADDINTQTIPITWVAASIQPLVQLPTTGINLLLDVPFNTTVPSGSNGFTRNAVDDSGRLAITSSIQYKPVNSIKCYYNSTFPFTVAKSMGILSGLNNWKLNIGLNINYGIRGDFDTSTSYYTGQNKIYFEILDKDGRVLIQMQKWTTNYYLPFNNRLMVNGQLTAEYTAGNSVYPMSDIVLIYNGSSLTVQVDGGSIFTITPIDSTATINSLSAFRFNCINDSSNAGLQGQEKHLQKAILYYNF